jgi:hypothetical protein
MLSGVTTERVSRYRRLFAARVLDARLAAAFRARAGRRFAAAVAWRDRAFGEAADFDSSSSAALAARERDDDGRVPARALADLALPLVRSLALFGGGGSATPARRAFERPMAIACLAERAPCFPSVSLNQAPLASPSSSSPQLGRWRCHRTSGRFCNQISQILLPLWKLGLGEVSGPPNERRPCRRYQRRHTDPQHFTPNSAGSYASDDCSHRSVTSSASPFRRA